uniref:Checkpoint protein n=1 Tax=Caenorhabditis japonica TaxID=281687 RepID=A0A8R1DS33_CAEJA
NDEPILSVEVRNPESDIVSHQVPITIILSRYWPSYARPAIADRRMSISMPPPKFISRFLHAFKNSNARVVKFTASRVGDLRISTRIDNGEIDASFADLQTAVMDGDSQEETASVELTIRNISTMFHSFAHTKSRVKMNIISHRMAEFTVINEDYNLSFIAGKSPE